MRFDYMIVCRCHFRSFEEVEDLFSLCESLKSVGEKMTCAYVLCPEEYEETWHHTMEAVSRRTEV
jgi:hypothetical protein